MAELSHQELQELLGAYALDAVEPSEAAALESHLQDCPRCSAELTAHRQVAGLFIHSGQAAPDGLWDRIVAGMQEAPPALRLERIRGSMREPGPPARPAARRAASQWRSRATAALAVAAAIAIAVLAVAVARPGGGPTTHTAGGAVTATATMADVHQALGERGTRKVSLQALGSQAWLDAVITPNGTGYVYDAHLTPLPADRTYQLWGVVGSRKISYGLLGTNPRQVIAFRAGTGLQALAVTDEVSSGVAVSRQPVVAAGAVNPAL